MAKMLTTHNANRVKMIGKDQPTWNSLRKKMRMLTN
jgi:hypothetical protein